jgi:hypothetical protein
VKVSNEICLEHTFHNIRDSAGRESVAVAVIAAKRKTIRKVEETNEKQDL